MRNPQSEQFPISPPEAGTVLTVFTVFTFILAL